MGRNFGIAGKPGTCAGAKRGKRQPGNIGRISRAAALAVASVILTGAIGETARGADDIYNSASGGNWNTAGNWSRGVIPPNGDRAFLNGLATSYTVALNTSYISPGLSFLVIDGGSSPNTTTLSQTTSTTMVAATEWIGDGGTGTAVYLQSAGSNADTGDLDLAHTNAAGFGQYKLQGGVLTVTGSEYVGFLGTGTFTQTGGTNTINGTQLSVGNSTLGTGLYTLNAASAATTVTNNGQTNVNAGGIMNIGASVSSFSSTFNAKGNVTVDGGQINVLNSGSFAFPTNSNLTVQNGGQFNYTGQAAGLSQGTTTVQTGGHLTLTNPVVGTTTHATLGISGQTEVEVQSVGSTFNIPSGGAFGAYELDLTAGASFYAEVDILNGASATLGRVVMSSDFNFSNRAGLDVLSGGTCTTDDVTVGGCVGDCANSVLTVRNAGTLTLGDGMLNYGFVQVDAGGTFNAGTGGTIFNFGSLFEIDGGTANLAGITDNNSAPGSISLLSGTLKASNLSSRTLASPTIGTNQNVNITGTTTINTPLSLVGGSLVTGNLVISGGTFNFTGGLLQITGSQMVTIGTGGLLGNSVTISGTQTLLVTGPTTIASGASLTALSTFQSGALVNNGTFIANGSNVALQSSMINNGTATLMQCSVSLGLQNNGTLSLPAGAVVSIGGGLLNEGTVTFDNATLTGGTVTNDFSGLFTGRGTLGLPLINNGTVALTGALAVTNLTNGGFIAANAGQNLQASGATTNAGTIQLNGGGFNGAGGITNTGTIQLNGGGLGGLGGITNSSGLIEGGGTVTAPLNNSGGIVFANNTTMPLTVSNLTTNAAGQLKAADGSTLVIVGAFANNGTVNPKGSNAIISGGAITNTGTIKGAGTVNNVVANTTGIVRAEGGELDLVASGNTNSGQIQAASGNTVLYVQGLAANNGTIALTGGTFDNGNVALANNGTISGNGIIRTGGLSNGNLMLLTDVATSIFGPVTNSTLTAANVTIPGTIKIVSNTTTFFGPVTNNGTIKVTSGVARFLGNGVSMTVGGTYNSDPSDNYFNGLAVTPGGNVLGGNGDRFFLTGGTALTNDGNWNVTGTLSANAVTNTGTFTQTGTLNEAANFTNSGTVTIGGVQNWAAGTTFSNTAGAAAFQSDAGSNVATPLAINAGGGAVTFGSTQHLASVSLSGGATASLTSGGDKVVRANAVSIAAGSKIDLSDNKLVTQSAVGSWNGSAYSGVLGLAASSRITTSQTSAASGLTTMAVAANADLHKTTFGGESVGNSDVLVMYTYAGDADLSGAINGDDYFRIDGGYSAHATGYDNGDFNLDGRIDADDYFIIDRNYARQGTAFSQSEPVMLQGVAVVPEPSDLAGTILLLPALGRRRTRRG